MNTETVNRVRAYMTAHRDGIVRDIMRLVRIPSIRSEASCGAPFGKACAAALDEAVSLFRENGFAVRVSGGHEYAVVVYGEGEPSLGFFGHTDVVPVGDDWVFTSPFEPIESDGYLIGRGVEDNKAGIVLSLYTMRAFRDLDLPLEGSMIAFLGSAEETGMEDISAFVQNEQVPRISIVPDNTYPVCLGEKGICHLVARAERPLHGLTRFEGGQAFNVILDRVTVGLRATPRLKSALCAKIADDADFSLEERGEELILSAHGLTAHASMPDGSVNAACMAAELLASLPELDENDREVLASLASVLGTVHGESLGIDRNDPYFGRVTAANGIVSLDGGYLSFTLDIRYGTVLDGEEMLASVKSHLASQGFALSELRENKTPFRLVENSPEALAMMDVYRSLSGLSECAPYYSGGGTYARHLPNAFSVGCAVPYLRGDKPFPKGHGEAHQSDECIYIDALIESAAMITLMALAADNAFRGDAGHGV